MELLAVTAVAVAVLAIHYWLSRRSPWVFAAIVPTAWMALCIFGLMSGRVNFGPRFLLGAVLVFVVMLRMAVGEHADGR